MAVENYSKYHKFVLYYSITMQMNIKDLDKLFEPPKFSLNYHILNINQICLWCSVSIYLMKPQLWMYFQWIFWKYIISLLCTWSSVSDSETKNVLYYNSSSRSSRKGGLEQAVSLKCSNCFDRLRCPSGVASQKLE